MNNVDYQLITSNIEIQIHEFGLDILVSRVQTFDYQ